MRYVERAGAARVPAAATARISQIVDIVSPARRKHGSRIHGRCRRSIRTAIEREAFIVEDGYIDYVGGKTLTPGPMDDNVAHLNNTGSETATVARNIDPYRSAQAPLPKNKNVAKRHLGASGIKYPAKATITMKSAHMNPSGVSIGGMHERYPCFFREHADIHQAPFVRTSNLYAR
jgi:hypothetical protein